MEGMMFREKRQLGLGDKMLAEAHKNGVENRF